MKIIITGATGLVGAEVVREAIKDEKIDEIILLVRSQPAVTDKKINVLLHKNFLDYNSLENIFKTADAIIWCLGISQTQVNKIKYEEITFGYTKACADFCLQTSPGIKFIFVSGDGADRTETSRTIFKRIKGKAENALLNSGLKNIFIVRPDAVRPKHKNPKAPFAYKLAYPLFPLIQIFAPNKIIWSNVLAKALLNIAENNFEQNIFENVQLKELGKKIL